ncbi:EAL domain-containing protein [Paludibacterium paludis]|nr:EAL domain-containing protein [Paludibacterium paludis]
MDIPLPDAGVEPVAVVLNPLLTALGFEPSPLVHQAGRISALHEDWTFSSVFQPVFSLRATDEAPGYMGAEALVRVRDGNGHPIPPPMLFAAETSPRRTVYLDRLLRCLHVANYRQSRMSARMLFLNVNARHLANVSEHHGQFFSTVLEKLGMDPALVCLEIVEDAVDDPARLLLAVQRYRQLGFAIALDDFGQGASNLERVWMLEPDFVKIDKRLMRRALMRPDLRDKLASLVDILHLNEARVIAEGIESEWQLAIAREAGCDFAQGYHLGRPEAFVVL